MNPEALNVYLICAALLTFNLAFLVVITGAWRSKAKVFVNPEDAETFKGEQEEQDVLDVRRAMAAHRNALESIPLFLILAFAHVATGATKTSMLAYGATFVVARWLHSICYLRGLQPWRSAFFALGFLAMLGVAVRLLVTALT